MALTLSRWIMAVAVGCAAITAAVIVRDGREREARVSAERSAESRALARTRLQYRRTHQRWRSLARRDSIVAAREGRRSSRAGELVVVAGAGLGSEVRAAIERLARRQWHALRIDSARVPTTVAMVREWERDSSIADVVSRGLVSFDYIVPTDASPECIVVVVVGSDLADDRRLAAAIGRRLTDPDYTPFVLGPCAFHARFGRPGASVERWLASRGHDLVSTPAWSPDAVDHGADWTWRRYSVARDAEHAGPYFVDFSSRWETPAARACLHGDLETCNQFVAPGALRPERTAVTTRQRWGGGGTSAFAPETYLSDLVSYLGPDRFSELWTTTGSVATAIHGVTGMTPGEWTRRWGLAFYGGHEVRGAGISRWESVAVLAVTAAAACVACAIAQRRQLR
jgi:hypothetical protein